MSGHSKWSTIKHKKAATDLRRGRLFTKLIKEIIVAARLGGGDPKGNPRLRTALLEARSSSVPGDNIDRAVKKGTGELAGESYAEVIYEGYGPGGVAILVEGLTDNHNRTTQEIRNLFLRYGGSLGENGCVNWMFARRGLFAIDRGESGEEAPSEEAMTELALELGAEDLTVEEEGYTLLTSLESFLAVQEELERRRIPILLGELILVPQSHLALPADRLPALLRLTEALEDHDDVQHVWTNLEVAPPAAASAG